MIRANYIDCPKKSIFNTWKLPENPSDNSGDIKWTTTVYIKDTGEIWMYGKLYGGYFSNVTDNHVTLSIGGETYELALGEHTQSYTTLTGSSDIKDQVIISSGIQNQFILKTLGKNAFSNEDYLPADSPAVSVKNPLQVVYGDDNINILSYNGSENKILKFSEGANITLSVGSDGDLIITAVQNSDTVNTAGATNLTGRKLFLIGAEQQTESPQTYSNQYVYIGTDNCLYSLGRKVLTEHQNIYSLDVKTSKDGLENTVVTYNPLEPGHYITFVQGSNVTIDSDAEQKTITISSKDTTYNFYNLIFKNTEVVGTYNPINSPDTIVKSGANVMFELSDDNILISSIDTKNTAGATEALNTKLYIIASQEQSTEPQTFTNSKIYIDNNKLHSNGIEVSTIDHNHNDIYLIKSGDTMSGILNMDNDIKFIADKYIKYNDQAILGYDSDSDTIIVANSAFATKIFSNSDLIHTKESSDYIILDSGNYVTTLDSRYVTLGTEQTITGLKIFNRVVLTEGEYIFGGKDEADNGMIGFSQGKTIIGSIGKSTTKPTHVRSKTGHATIGTGNDALYTILDTGNYTSTLDSRYVLKSGDSMTGPLNIHSGSDATSLVLDCNSDSYTSISIKNKGIQQGAYSANANQPYFYDGEWRKVITENNYTSTLDTRYVKKSGDTITGELIISVNSPSGIINVTNSGESFSAIDFSNSSGLLGIIGVDTDNEPLYKYPSEETVYKILHTGNYSPTLDARYIQKSGDTMTGALNLPDNTWNNVGNDVAIGDVNLNGILGIKSLNSADIVGLAFFSNDNASRGQLTINPEGNILWNSYKIWHEGNDGNESGLDAGLFCGYNETDFYRSSISTIEGEFALANIPASRSGSYILAGEEQSGSVFIFHAGGTNSTLGFMMPNGNSSVVKVLSCTDSDPVNWKELGTIAYTTGSISNADDSDKLDGVHLNEIFTNFSSSNDSVYLTIGGVTKSLLVPFATKASDADTLDGIQSTSFLRNSLLSPQSLNANQLTNNLVVYTPSSNMSGWSSSLEYTNFPTGKPSEGGFSLFTISEGTYNRQVFGTYNDPHIYIRTQSKGTNSTIWGDWNKVALITDNVASASRLQNTVKIYGNDFDGTSDLKDTDLKVNDTIFSLKISAGNILSHVFGIINLGSPSGNSLSLGAMNTSSINFYAGGTSSGTSKVQGRWNTTGLGVGTSSPAYKLDVNGTMRVTGESIFESALNVKSSKSLGSLYMGDYNTLDTNVLSIISKDSSNNYKSGLIFETTAGAIGLIAGDQTQPSYLTLTPGYLTTNCTFDISDISCFNINTSNVKVTSLANINKLYIGLDVISSDAKLAVSGLSDFDSAKFWDTVTFNGAVTFNSNVTIPYGKNLYVESIKPTGSNRILSLGYDGQIDVSRSSITLGTQNDDAISIVKYPDGELWISFSSHKLYFYNQDNFSWASFNGITSTAHIENLEVDTLKINGTSITPNSLSAVSTMSASPSRSGMNTVDSLTDLPVDKDMILANLDTNTELSLSEPLTEGTNITVIINPTSGFTQTFTQQEGWTYLDGTSISLPANNIVKMNITCYGENKYIISLK